MSMKPHKHEPEKTGHSYDGIEEYNNPLPKWWLYIFYGTIVWALIYTVFYPAWPMIERATPGILGYSTRAEVAREISRFEEMNAPIRARLVAADLADIPADPELRNFAVNGGAAVFRTWCAQCHGAGAAGVQAGGFPNLLDDDWLWGGTLEDIRATVAHGIRNTQDPDARYSQMPAFGDMLSDEEITQVVQHVRAISGQEYDSAAAGAGEILFADNCAACHGEAGTGDRAQGAPNLTDSIWLYGGGVETLTHTVRNARFGVMPAFAGRLGEAEIRQVAVYVHQLGGGEAVE